MKYANLIIQAVIALFLIAGAVQSVEAAQVDYSLTGTLSQTSGPASPFDGVSVTVAVTMDSGLSPNSSNVTSTFAEANYSPSVSLTAGGLGPLACGSATNVTLRDQVSGNDRLTLASCQLITVVLNASVSIGQSLSTSAPASISATTATGNVSLTSILSGSTSVFSLMNGSLSASGASPPTLSVSPSAVNLAADFGTTTAMTQDLTLSASSPVSYSVSDSGEAWLSATPGSGNTGTAVTVSANPTGLSPGTYNGTVMISSASQGTTNVPVTFEVVGSLPDLSISPPSLSFDYQEGGANPAAQQLSVSSGTSVAINVAASTNSGGSWLSATPGSGNTPQSVSVSVNPAGLVPGAYSGTVTVTSAGAGNSPQTAMVTLNVTAAPTISVAPSALTFDYQSGGANPAAQSVNLSAVNGPVSYTAAASTTSGGGWLSVTPTSGSSPQSLSVAVNPGALAPGSYSGMVTVTSPEAGNSPQTVAVTLNVTAAPTISVAPSALTFNYQIGDANPAGQNVNLTATDGPVSFTAAAATSSGGNWLSASPANGNSPQSIGIAVNPSGLAAGTYNGTVTVDAAAAGNGPQVVAVTLNVTAAPTISASPSALSFNFQIGGSNPASQNVNVTATDGPVSVNAAAATSSGGNWLSVTPGSGNTPQTLTVSVDPSGLAAGTYNGTVTVTSATASNSPQVVAVTFTVSAAPVLTVSPAQLTFNYQVGGSNPASQAVSITGSASLAYTAAASGGAWLSISSTSGNTPGSLNVQVDPSGLAAGTYNGTVTVTSGTAGNSPQTVAVSLVVSAAPTLSVAPGSLTFNFQVGGSAPVAQNISINGSSAIAFSAAASTSSGGSWLSVTPGGGTTNASASVAVNPGSLAAGTYNGMVTVTSAAAGNSPQTVAVTLVVSAAPTLSVAPASLTFNFQSGGAAPAAQNISINGSSAIGFTAAASTSAGGGWLSVTPTSGTTNVSASVSVNPGALAAGTYNGMVTVTSPVAGNSPQTVAVTLIVAAQPNLTVSPGNLSFSFQQGGAAPAAKQLSVGSTASSLSFTAQASSTGNWLSVTPGSGSTNGTLSVSVNTNGLAPGTYNGTVMVSSTGAGNSPLSVPVSLTVTSAPTLSVSPSQLSFNYLIGAANPTSQSISVAANTATPAVSFTAAASGGAWLTVTPGSGSTPNTLSVSVNPAGLAPGNYNGTVTVTAASTSNSPQTIAVALTVTAPTLTLAPAQLSFGFQVGGSNPAAQTVNVSANSATAYTAAASGGAWLSVTPAGGTTDGALTVAVDPTGLAAGTYNGTVTVTAPTAGNSPQAIPVTLTVSAAPVLTVSPSQLTFNFQSGGTAPAAQALNITGSAPLTYNVAASGGAWLAVTPSNGSTPGSASVSVNPAGLAPGTYNGTIDITSAGAGNSPQTVAVALVVSSAPAISASPSALTFNYQVGAANPAAQNISVGATSAVSYTAAASGGAWLSVSPGGGTTDGAVSVAVNPTGLAPGTYNGTVTVTSAAASNSPQTVTVTLVVTAASFTASPAQLSFVYQVGGSNPAAQSISVSSAAASGFSVSVAGGTWLSASPANGTTPATVSVAVDPTGLAPGNYNGTVTLAPQGAGQTQQVVQVALAVTSAPTLSASPATLAFTYQIGGTAPAARTLSVTATSAVSFNAAASGGAWLAVTPASGSTPGSLSVSIDPTGLAPGSYSGTVSITSSEAANSPQNVPVTLTVTGPTLSVSPSQLSFSFQTGGAAPAPQAVSLSTSGQANFTAAVVEGDFLSVTPTAGSAPSTINVSVDPGSLAPGTYAGSISITPEGGTPSMVAVTLTVSENPLLTATPAGLSFQYFVDGEMPAAQAINLTATADMDFTIQAAGGDWLSVTPDQGVTPASLTAMVDPVGLEPGEYAGSIAITAPTASNSPVTVPVTLTVILAPVFNTDGLVTSTAFITGDSPAAGSLAALFGTFPGIEFEGATSLPLPTRIQGLEVRVRPITSSLGEGASGAAQDVGFMPAPLLFVSPEQISFQAPWDLAPGPVEMIVSSGGVDSAPVEVAFSEINPGIFTFAFGPGPAVAFLVDGMVAQPAGSIEGVTTRPARIGEPLIILSSGLGPLTGPPLPSGVNSLDETGAYVRRDTVVEPRVLVGGQEAEVYFSGASPEFVGVMQINLTAIPEGVEPGPAVPLILDVNGVMSRMDVTIAVDPAPEQ